MLRFFEAFKEFMSLMFHKRNLIVVSEHKVKHYPMSGKLQFLVVIFTVGFICWASYSTGKYMASDSVLKKQARTIQSYTNERIESAYAPDMPIGRAMPKETKRSQDAFANASAKLMFTPSTLDSIKLYARVAELEKQVNDLQATNEAIVDGVQRKTDGRIAGLEKILKKTGLSLSKLKDDTPKAYRDALNAQGGPYLPTDFNTVPEAEKMFEALDDLNLLEYIATRLPVAIPMDNPRKTSNYGHRVDPFTKHLAFHGGVDFAGRDNKNVKTTLDGVVIRAGKNGAYGNMIDIKHDYGVVTRYAHLKKIKVKKGQQVQQGDIIGIQGNTGRSTASHLHYEIRYRNRALNPRNFFKVGQYVFEE